MITIARCTLKFPDEFLLTVSKLAEHTDDIVPIVLEAGGKVVLDKVRGNLRSVLSGKSTGALERSLGLSPAKLGNDGNFNVKIGFTENRRDGVSNAILANLLEYGKSGQPARPFLKPAQRQSRRECIDTMKSKLKEEIEKL